MLQELPRVCAVANRPCVRTTLLALALASLTLTPVPAHAAQPPGEVSGLRFVGPEMLQWDAVASATAYDMVRGVTTVLPVGTDLAWESCVAPGVSGSSAIDTILPPEGTAFWYLVRARGAGGTGGYSTDSSGIPRNTATCNPPGTCIGLADGTPCNDGIACTRGETCQAGVCQTGAPSCPTADLCVPYYCDLFNGACLPATVTCAVPANCWSSVCNSATGKCEGKLNSGSPLCGDECATNADCGGQFPNSCVDGRCSNDGSGCTESADCGFSQNACILPQCVADQSGLMRCVITDVSCGDGDPCTQDTCDPLHGCGHFRPDPTVLCDDLNPCTTDSCGPYGCVNTAIDGCTN